MTDHTPVHEEGARVAGTRPEDRRPERVEDAMPTSPVVVHEALRADGEAELERSAGGLVWSGVAGGLSLGLSMAGSGLLLAHLPRASWAPLVALGFSLGFVVVMIGRQGLVTESTLTGVLPVLHRPTASRATKLLRLWACVLVGNMAGAIVFAVVAARTGMFPTEARAAFAELGARALERPFVDQLLGAIFAGFVITLALWTSTAASSGRVLVIIALTWLVAVGHFGHIVSGSVEALASVASGQADVGTYLVGFFVPVLLGNLVGGTVFVAGLNHLQVRKELPGARRRGEDAHVRAAAGAASPAPA